MPSVEAEFPRIVDVLLNTGLVSPLHPSFRLLRGIHGGLAYQVQQQTSPQFNWDNYVVPLFLTDSPPRLAGVEREQFAGLLDMLLRLRLYAAMEADQNLQQLAESHLELLSYTIRWNSDIFLQERTMAGRTTQYLAILAIAEARASDSLQLTEKLMTELLSSRLAPELQLSDRLLILAKCFLDLLFVGSRFPEHTLTLLGRLVDLEALQDGLNDDSNGSPNPTTAGAFVRLRTNAAYQGETLSGATLEALQRVAGRAALLFEGLGKLRPVETRKVLSCLKWSSRQRLMRWADSSVRVNPIDRTQELSLDMLIRRFADQAVVGLFSNVVIRESAEVRNILNEAMDEWLSSCERSLRRGKPVTGWRIVKYFRRVLFRVLNSVKSRLCEPVDALE
jgi:hypothetical protein